MSIRVLCIVATVAVACVLPARASAGFVFQFAPTRVDEQTGLTFPSVGCWRVVGELGRARLTFVVRVVVR